ncbi:hypothetical protein HDU76_012155 [Blyttiomyces sp. JEL0837]|nr:hypothetical protein HDU76_012155 [Blyttiomyces sp. JEL0837]
MCFIGFVTKLILGYIALKWFFSSKRNKACKNMIKDDNAGASCPQKGRRWGPPGENGGIIIQLKHDGVRSFVENAIDRFNMKDLVNIQNLNAGETTTTTSTSSSTIPPYSPINNTTTGTTTVTATSTTSTRTQIEENPTKYVISIDVPGLRQDDLQVTVLDDVRKVIVRAGTTPSTPSSEPSSPSPQSNNVRNVDVCISLPRTVDLSSIKGGLNLGVLSLSIERTLAEGRRVAINNAGSNGSSGDEGWEKAAL